MAFASACYGMHGASGEVERAKYPAGEPCDLWPWEPEAWKPSTPLRDLAKAGALDAAEYDRLAEVQRLQKSAQTKES